MPTTERSRFPDSTDVYSCRPCCAQPTAMNPAASTNVPSTREHAQSPKACSVGPLRCHLSTGVATTRSGGRLLSEPKFAMLAVYQPTLVRSVGEGQHAQHAQACNELARHELAQTFIRRFRFGGVNFLAPSRPSRPIEGHPSQTPCFHGSGPNRTAIAFVRFAR
jgi:hypothetical protein